MRTNVLGKFARVLMCGVVAISLTTSCDKDDKTAVEEIKDEVFTVLYSSSFTGSTKSYIQSTTTPRLGEVTFEGFGYEVPSTRTSRVVASRDGSIIYALDYGGGTITKFDAQGGQNYTVNDQITYTYALGTEYARWTKISDENALLHNVVTENIYTDEEETIFSHVKATARLVNVELADLTMRTIQGVECPRSDFDKANHMYIGRIDSPVVTGGKAYYGVSKSGTDKNGEDPDDFEAPDYYTTTLIVDYPSLQNPKTVTSTISQGSNYGYRASAAHADEKGDVYQMSRTHMLKLSNGEYDNSYQIDFKGQGLGCLAWFYAGNGIGYALTYDFELGAGSTAKAWGITRVDLYAKTIIEMNMPDNLYLWQYQMTRLGDDGKLYMSIAPVGEDGNIYIFDPTKADANGFEVGAKLLNKGTGASYIGIL